MEKIIAFSSCFLIFLIFQPSLQPYLSQSAFSFQILSVNHKEHQTGQTCCRSIREGLCIKCTLRRKRDRQDTCHHKIHNLSKQWQAKGKPCHPKRRQRIHKHILEAEWDHHQCKHLDSPYGQFPVSCIVCKNLHKILRQNSGYKEHHRCKCNT